MEISIKYDSIWGNSFIEAENEDNKKRKYIASLSSMNDNKNKDNQKDLYKRRGISLTTVYGLMYRLVGARAPLSQLLKTDDSIVMDLIKGGLISFENKRVIESDELVYLKNNSLNTDQNSYSGVPDESMMSMGLLNAVDVLFYSRDELVDYLKTGKKVKKHLPELSIIDLSKKLEEIYKTKELKLKKIEADEVNHEYNEINKAYEAVLNKEIHLNANLGLLAINKSIYETFKDNDEANKYLTSSSTFSGVSLNGNSFTLKDFMKKFASPKIVYGNPYKTDFWVINPNSKDGKNMKFNKMLTKSNGELIIKIDCDRKTASDIKLAIDNAGVSAFYLGKKGLAYTDKITL